MSSRLKLNRLSVHRGRHVMYDEHFHEGVNIIHGDNGSGKSTITDFIYFALGGELTEWRTEAELANYVIAEVTAGNAVLTLRRDVSKDKSRPMQIFFGAYEAALKADMRLWEQFPYKRTASQYSFSQILFQAIGIPEAVSAGDSNVTMYQLLRVLYSDQLTPIQRIFRVENFDPWEVRQAVGDLLCGVGGYDLHELRLQLRSISKQLDVVTTEYKSLIAVAASLGDDVSIEYLDEAQRNAVAERNELHAKLTRLLESPNDEGTKRQETELEKSRKRELSSLRRDVALLTEKIETLEYEQTDGTQFIKYLTEAIADFDDAADTFVALGSVRFEFCPACFATISHPHDESNRACHLCGTTATDDQDDSRTLAVKLDLQMQLRESGALHSAREKLLGEARADLRAATRKLNRLESESDTARTAAASRFEGLLADTSQRIGYADAAIEQLRRREQLALELRRVSDRRATLRADVEKLKDQILKKESAQEKRKDAAYSVIERNAMDILGKDLAEHSDFGDIKSLTFDFAGDWIALNDNKNRVGSASGMVILKNSFLLGLFMASLEDENFFLPRFMLMDNIEDKGMVPERSWNFQHLILNASESAKVANQVIFSTSKIAPDLEDSPYVVGRKYTKLHHSLIIK